MEIFQKWNVSSQRANHQLKAPLLLVEFCFICEDCFVDLFQLFCCQFNANFSALHQAASSDSTNEILLLFLSIESIDIDFVGKFENKDYFNWTPLHHAIDDGAMENVKSLIEFGASTSAVNDRNETPLEMARRHGDRKEMEEVLENAEKVIDFSFQIIYLPLNTMKKFTNNYHSTLVLLAHENILLTFYACRSFRFCCKTVSSCKYSRYSPSCLLFCFVVIHLDGEVKCE